MAEGYDLIPGDSPLLRQRSEEFDWMIPQRDPLELAALLEQRMNDLGGLGLSAVQIGIPLRVFSMRTRPDVTVFNPRIVDMSSETVDLDEGCLTYPGLVLKVKRPRMIKVRFTMKNEETVTMKFDGMTARIFLHELDHLDGVRHIDRVGRVKLMLASRRAAKAGHKYQLKELI